MKDATGKLLLPKEIDELLEKEVKLDFEPIEIEGLGVSLFFLSERALSSLMPLLVGDFKLLDYEKMLGIAGEN